MADYDDFIRVLRERLLRGDVPAKGNTPRPPDEIAPIKKDDGITGSSPVGSLLNLRSRGSLPVVKIVLLTALQKPEGAQLISVIGKEGERHLEENVLYRVSSLEIDSKQVPIAIASQNEMGMVPAAILTAKAIRFWNPKLVVMTGICAGVRNRVELGDLIVVQSVFDYNAGKVLGGKLQPDHSPVQLNQAICQMVRDFASHSPEVAAIQKEWNRADGAPSNPIRAHVGSFASGSAVVADEELVSSIQEHKRTLLGLDMEAYGVAKTCAELSTSSTKYLIVKGVSDFADDKKADDMQEFCAFSSALFLIKFLKEHWSAIDEL